MSQELDLVKLQRIKNLTTTFRFSPINLLQQPPEVANPN